MTLALMNPTPFFQASRPRQKPFLKWAGGKFRVLDHILPVLPDGARFVEPFTGSAAVALNVDFPLMLLADANSDLINMYNHIQKDVNGFIFELSSLFGKYNDERSYCALREEFNSTGDTFRKSLIFIYLNRHGFNGLCRYNSKGVFNVPFGRYEHPTPPVTEIKEFYNRTRLAKFVCCDFEEVMSRTVRGDVIYCDPPYFPLSTTSNFTSYSAGSFNVAHQYRLAELSRACAARGVPVVISNHDTPASRALYSDAELIRFDVKRVISSKASTRGRAPELLAIYR